MSQKLRGERGLAGPVRTRDDDDLLFTAHTAISPLISRGSSKSLDLPRMGRKSTKSSQTPWPPFFSQLTPLSPRSSAAATASRWTCHGWGESQQSQVRPRGRREV